MPKKKVNPLDDALDQIQPGPKWVKKIEDLKPEQPVEKPKLELVKPRIKGNDAIISIVVETVSGKTELEFSIIGFCGNVPAPKRSEEGLKTMFRDIFIKEFGGTIK
jgi:hypothetical protein